MVKAKRILLEPNPNQFIRPQNIQQQSQVASDQNKSFTKRYANQEIQGKTVKIMLSWRETTKQKF